MSARLCPSCGFQQDDRSESGKCLGCGYQLDPHPDHSAPAPGFHVDDYDGPHVVTEQDVDRYPELEGVIIIRELAFEYGRGIGAEPYGYHTLRREQVVDAETYIAAHPDSRLAEELADEACPNCGSRTIATVFAQDGAGIAGVASAACDVCDAEVYADRWA